MNASRHEDYGRRAVDVLRKAVEIGLIRDPKLLRHKDFLNLQNRDDLKKLLHSLEAPRAA
jgi:hypothetical protein